MIRLAGVSYRYPETSGRALNGIDLAIAAGEYVLLAGASGSGKSTLGFLFNGLIPHFFGGRLDGRVLVDGIPTTAARVPDFLTRVGLVFQNPDAQLFNSTVEDEMAFGLESLGLSPDCIRERIRRTAETLAIRELLARSPMRLSGGEKRIAAVAAVLCLEPPLLLLDEPFAHLDWVGAERLRAALCRIHRSGRSVVVVEQRLNRCLRDATRCLLLESGRLIFDGPPRQARSMFLETHLLPRYPSRTAGPPSDSGVLIQARDIGHVADGRTVLEGVSFEVRKGEILALVGRNGAGKTTLIKILNGLVRPASGSVWFAGRAVLGLSPEERVSQVGISFQNPNDQFFKVRVEDELRVGLKAGTTAAGREWFQELCRLFDLQGLLERSPYRLSEGQKKRLAIASILALQPRVLILDEPTLGQDGRFLEALAETLLTLRDRGFSILLVTHDLEFTAAVADRWVVLHAGRVAGQGTAAELLADQALVRLGALPPAGSPETASDSERDLP